MMAYRVTDGRRTGRTWVWLRRIDWMVRLLVPVFAVAVAAYAVINITQESQERRDQNCILFERQAQASAQRLIGTYDYLETLPPSEYGTNLTRTIIRNLPTTEAEARATIAPAYCQEPGVGLKERPGDPKIPEHRDFSDRAQPR